MPLTVLPNPVRPGIVTSCSSVWPSMISSGPWSSWTPSRPVGGATRRAERYVRLNYCVSVIMNWCSNVVLNAKRCDIRQ